MQNQLQQLERLIWLLQEGILAISHICLLAPLKVAGGGWVVQTSEELVLY